MHGASVAYHHRYAPQPLYSGGITLKDLLVGEGIEPASLFLETPDASWRPEKERY